MELEHELELHYLSKPEWLLPYSHCGGECNAGARNHRIMSSMR